MYIKVNPCHHKMVWWFRLANGYLGIDRRMAVKIRSNLIKKAKWDGFTFAGFPYWPTFQGMYVDAVLCSMRKIAHLGKCSIHLVFGNISITRKLGFILFSFFPP